MNWSDFRSVRFRTICSSTFLSNVLAVDQPETHMDSKTDLDSLAPVYLSKEP